MSSELVSICVITYNRSRGLRIAVESVLRQDHTDFEVIICDNASTDDTLKVVEDLCRIDSRVRHLRHPENMGPVRNFMSGIEHCRGRYFMWLADDDWLDPNYLSTCLSFLRQNPDHALACGRILYYHDGKYRHEGRVITLEDDSPLRRVLNYYRLVGDNGTYYGLMRLEQVRKVPMNQVVGTDWFFVAGIAFQGKIRSLGTTCIHRDYTWDKSSFQRISQSHSHTDFDARHPYLSIAVDAHEDILMQPLYQSLSPGQRTRFALHAFWTLCRSKRVRLWRTISVLFRLLWQHGRAITAS